MGLLLPVYVALVFVFCFGVLAIVRAVVAKCGPCCRDRVRSKCGKGERGGGGGLACNNKVLCYAWAARGWQERPARMCGLAADTGGEVSCLPCACQPYLDHRTSIAQYPNLTAKPPRTEVCDHCCYVGFKVGPAIACALDWMTVFGCFW